MLKYNNEIQEGYHNRLKNKLYGLLCEFEKDREWESFLNSILMELLGFDEAEHTISYYELYHKISSLRFLRYKYFRQTIFDAMSLLDRMNEDR